MMQAVRRRDEVGGQPDWSVMTTATASHTGAAGDIAGNGRKRLRAERVEHPSPAQRAARGKAARAEVPRSTHGEWEPSSLRPDPVAVLLKQAQTRVAELVPIRHG